MKHTRYANAFVDRLSSLHDDILIRIISHLPFPYVVETACLSSRWRGLWTQLTSIDITRLDLETSPEFFTTIDDLLSRITSPCIDSFSLELDDESCFWSALATIDSWIETLTNVRELKVTLPSNYGIIIPVLHRFILKTQASLISLECRVFFDYEWASDVEFNLSNLRNLSLRLQTTKNINKWLKKLIKGCPLLVEFALSCTLPLRSDSFVECSHQYLRRLTVDIPNVCKDHKVVINAPKLEYLSVCGNNYSIFCFDKAPVMLREARITINNFRDDKSSDEVIKLWLPFYKDISNVVALEFDVLRTQHLSTVFCRATRLTLNMRAYCNIQTVLSLVESCPVLNFLTLRLHNFIRDEPWELPKPSTTLLSVPQRIHIEIYDDPYCGDSYINFEIAEYLLSNAINLTHFKYDLTKAEEYWRDEGAKVLRRRESELCKRLYKCPTASKACVIEFVGMFFKMSQKAGPKAWSENRKVSPFISAAIEE